MIMGKGKGRETAINLAPLGPETNLNTLLH